MASPNIPSRARETLSNRSYMVSLSPASTLDLAPTFFLHCYSLPIRSASFTGSLFNYLVALSFYSSVKSINVRFDPLGTPAVISSAIHSFSLYDFKYKFRSRWCLGFSNICAAWELCRSISDYILVCEVIFYWAPVSTFRILRSSFSTLIFFLLSLPSIWQIKLFKSSKTLYTALDTTRDWDLDWVD